MDERALTLASRWIAPTAEAAFADGACVVVEGRLVAVAHGGEARRLVAAARGAVVEVDGVIAPGLVNAHVHLDLSALAGRVPAPADDPRGPFVAWIGALLRERAAASREVLLAAAADAARGLLVSGTTAVGDIDTLGLSAEALAASPLRAVLFREVLDGARPERAARALDDLEVALAAPLSGAGPRARGLSPHAPHTVSRELLRALGVRRLGLPVQVHWAETVEEVDWLTAGTGPFAHLLGPSPRTDGLALLDAAGLLAGASLVHGNHPAPGEPEALARAGASVVHCPGTHAFFARAPFPWERYAAAGVTLALGTDSRASNGPLDLRAELAAARRALPGIRPGALWHAATAGGARALGLDAEVGVLAPGLAADVVEFDVAPDGAASGRRLSESMFDTLTRGDGLVTRVWCSGRLAVDRASD